MSKLYIVPTPIGNLEDMTFRAVKILQTADLILAEDTRTTAFLLQHFDIHTPMQSHHKFNEHHTTDRLVQLIQNGKCLALVSDAGTPAISDPGFLLVRACVEANLEVECLPGATAFVPALVNSGLPCDRFCFEGFLPVKKGRQTRLKLLANEKRTMIFYESPFRLQKTLAQLCEIFGKDRKASVSREISKMFEETCRGTLEELSLLFTEKKAKGEMVLIIEGSDSKQEKITI